MNNLIIIVFDDYLHAEKARRHILSRERKASMGLEDAVLMEKTRDGRIRFRHLSKSVLGGAFCGALVGMLFGVLILNPVFAVIGLLAGLVIGIVAGTTSIGVDPELVRSQAGSMLPGNTALCVLDSDAEKVLEEIRGFDGHVLGTKICTHENDLWKCEIWPSAHYGVRAAIAVL